MPEEITTHVLRGRAVATITQQFEFVVGGMRSSASVDVVTEVADGRLTNPVLVSCDQVPESVQARDQVDAWARDNVGLGERESLFGVSIVTPPVEGLSRSQKLDLLALNTSYALRWLEDCEDPDGTNWIDGSVDVIAHQISCCLCQWFNLDGVPTSDTQDYLDLRTLPKLPVLRRELEKYLNETESCRN